MKTTTIKNHEVRTILKAAQVLLRCNVIRNLRNKNKLTVVKKSQKLSESWYKSAYEHEYNALLDKKPAPYNVLLDKKPAPSSVTPTPQAAQPQELEEEEGEEELLSPKQDPDNSPRTQTKNQPYKMSTPLTGFRYNREEATLTEVHDSKLGSKQYKQKSSDSSYGQE